MADEDKNNIDEPLSLVNLYLDEIVFVKLRGDRDLVGRLHGYDSHCNIVLGEVEETIWNTDPEATDKPFEKKNSEMLFVRGDSVVFIGSRPTAA